MDVNNPMHPCIYICPLNQPMSVYMTLNPKPYIASLTITLGGGEHKTASAQTAGLIGEGLRIWGLGFGVLGETMKP